ncbi:hypothetical protein DFH11DRAFT_1722828 [Phellopilus nigrolimitatus]|nr:hypothetical protein DFH11DRAFT_1722828 [Phellopilus nigrolimitatus]
MVGTPQLPLKYRRKGDPDYRVYSPDPDMAYHSSTSSFHSHFSSDDYLSRSPVPSSSSIAPSSPVRSLRTPEPPSSPFAEPYVASSPRSFWDVVSNHSPDFPCKTRSFKSPPTDSVFRREQFFPRRRSSSASAPALVSDVDPSEYSVDIDPFHIDDESADDFYEPGKVSIADMNDDSGMGVRITNVRHDGGGDVVDDGKGWGGEIDVAAVLLDLSRHARIAPAESKAVDVGIKSIDLPPVKSQIPPRLSTPSLSALDSAVSSCPISNAVTQVEVEDVIFNSTPATTSTDVANVEMIASGDLVTCNEVKVIDDVKIGQAEVDDNLVSGADSVVAAIFLDTLTPLSSPMLPATELADADVTPSSPATNTLSLAESSFQKPYTVSLDWSHTDKESSRPASPIPGPSKSRSTSADPSTQDERSTRVAEQKPRKSKSKRGLSQAKTETAGQLDTKKARKKRSRRPSIDEARSLSPVPSASGFSSRPCNKRSRQTIVHDDTSQRQLESDSTKTADVSLHSTATPSVRSTSLVPSDPENPLADESETADADSKDEVCGCLIQAMALSRASSMPASSLLREVLRENPHLDSQRTKKSWLRLVEDVLSAHEVFGRIRRDGLDADDKPLETQWFYIPENDPDQDRAALLREMMPKKRNATKKHKQYFYKPLGKITRWDAEDDA